MKKLLFLIVTLLVPLTVLPARESSVPPRTDVKPQPRQARDPAGEKAWLAHGFTETQLESLREAFRWGIESKFIPGGALLVIHRGEPVFREAFGVANLETKRPFAVDAPCRIASVTKPHTATLLALLVDRGKLSWDDPVDKYLPQFAKVTIRGKVPASRPPKIRELLSHTAGFPGNDERRAGGPGFRMDGTLAQAVDDIARTGLATEPGSGFVYTGLGYMVAGRVAEVVTGQEFGALMSERLLKPVGANTAVFQSAAPEELKSRMPTRYQREGGQLVKANSATDGEGSIAFPSPGGGLVSTLDDVAHVMMLHRNRGIVDGKRLIAPEMLQAQYRRQPATGREGYGLGFNILRTDEQGIGDRIRHTGASGTFVVIDFKEDLLVVMLTQVPTKQTQPFGDRLMKAINSVFSPR